MQRLTKPRIAPLDLAEIQEETLGELFPNRSFDNALNINKTLARHPRLYKQWLPFAVYLLSEQSLPKRDREILILRIGWLCQAPYEWQAHVHLAKAFGLNDEEIERIKQGPQASGWTELDELLLRAVDELHGDAMISDTTWEGLSKNYNTEQLIDLIFTVGQYNLVCMALNSLGIQIDERLSRGQPSRGSIRG
ncbi:MAG: carboxymuconolactone decarboxylase family protein [Deltaproteobacteria bacterium]|nr:carboxymuconolactone decarboxylase family protein [Deltaproteobacteria bacterium]